MKNQDFSIFQKLFQIVSRGFLCTPPVSCGPKQMVSMGVSLHNVVRSPDNAMCRRTSYKNWKKYEKLSKNLKNLLTRNPVEVENKIAPKLMLKKTKIKDVIIPNMCV